MTECVNCKCSLGAECGELPFTAHDGETWCPQCFCYKRAPLEPQRYYPPGFAPVQCLACNKKTVAIGDRACGQCSSPFILYLAPKEGVSLGNTGSKK